MKALSLAVLAGVLLMLAAPAEACDYAQAAFGCQQQFAAPMGYFVPQQAPQQFFAPQQRAPKLYAAPQQFFAPQRAPAPVYVPMPQAQFFMPSYAPAASFGVVERRGLFGRVRSRAFFFQ